MYLLNEGSCKKFAVYNFDILDLNFYNEMHQRYKRAKFRKA